MRAFTLAELLLVIGIVAILMALLLPAVSSIRRKARQAQTSALLSSIATALDQYQSDFGDYPRFSLDDQPPGTPNPLNAAEDRGARLLARAMLGPAPAKDPNINHDLTSGGPYASPQEYLDACNAAFQDGNGEASNPFGFKENIQIVQREGEVGAFYPGKVFSYLDPERYLLRETSDTAWQGTYKYGPDAVMLDTGFEKPILYYPGLRKKPDMSKPVPSAPTIGQFIDEFNQDQPQLALYNSFDNRAHLSRTELRKLLGDESDDGIVGPNEKEAASGPYLLIAVGTEGLYNVPIANFQATTRPAQ